MIHQARCFNPKTAGIKGDSNEDDPGIEMEKCSKCTNEYKVNEFDMHYCFCEYCQNTWPYSEIDNHREECGNRTEFCNRCNSHIFRKHLSTHNPANGCIRPVRNKKSLEELKKEVRNYIRDYQ